ncbi:TIGR03089 family protein [Corynebacterium alimapuense]|uniref:TIGR03089 family protein n=1 Tax=Corynebacterium alimapuense TaxID=1576874 RepID=A0A3M8K6C9_9CORY|nr:TIGR03089 family protein [Corynebacterium alimapuense]RNE48771.1 TIGR03089 family protein [Corynebacterium alimapuense]
MELLAHLLKSDPASPRLTVYNEATGARLDFSAQTLDNWASKIGNMLLEELDLESGSVIHLDLPVGWQAATIVLGALAAGIDYRMGVAPDTETEVVFTSPERFENYSGIEVVVVTDDPFGRGVVESGGQLPVGAIDFGPTVRFYGDQFFGPAPSLIDVVSSPSTPERLLSTGWHDVESMHRCVLAPLAAGGSAVVVSGLAGAKRLDEIAAAEKVTARL